MSTARAEAPLAHEAFRQRQKAAQLDGLSYKSVRVAWTDLGKGKPVILLHGIPTWSFLYNEVIALLAQHNRVIAPDFLGHGYSDRRDFFDRSLLAQTDMIILLMDHLGIKRASFVGHDKRRRLRFLADRRHDRARKSELALQIAKGGRGLFSLRSTTRTLQQGTADARV